MFRDVSKEDLEQWLEIYIEGDWAYAYDLYEFISIMKNRKKEEERKKNERGETV